jgi:hypothetical protein
MNVHTVEFIFDAYIKLIIFQSGTKINSYTNQDSNYKFTLKEDLISCECWIDPGL